MIRETMRARRGRRGTSLVETAIALNVLLLLIFGIYEFSRLLMVRQLLDNAARGAARVACSGTYDRSEAEIKAYARTLLVGQELNQTPTIQVYRCDAQGRNLGPWTDAAFGEGIAVQIDLDFKPLLPGFGILPSTIPMTARSIMRSEGD